MGVVGIKLFFKRSIYTFSLLFILTFPYRFYYLPDIGIWLKPWLECITKNVFGIEDGFFYSDSTLIWYFSLLLLLFSLITSLIWTFFTRAKNDYFLYFGYRIVLCYLALILLNYGFNKVFIYQFYPPEPNILYTPLGQLSPDILYWSTMGTAPIYSVFAGLLEVISALLLVFRRTRILGACISLMVLINVFMVNISFGISVKQFSLFLILLNLIILSPYFKTLVNFFVGTSYQSNKIQNKKPLNPTFNKYYPILKYVVILFLIIESASVYIEKGAWNSSEIQRPEIHGAYSVGSNESSVKRVFFHSANYFIIQNDKDSFNDYAYRRSNDQLILSNYDGGESKLTLKKTDETNYILRGNLFGDTIEWNLHKLNLKALPINR